MNQKYLLPREVYASEEHQMLKESVEEYYKSELEPNREQWEADGFCSREVWLKAGELGLLGLTMPAAYGGAELDFSFSALVIEELARFSAESPAISMHSEIVMPYILTYGSEALKQKYLPKMATGEIIGSLGMTEPSTGSDLQAIRTTAVDKGDHYLVNGSKTFITIGYTSDMTIVACKTREKGISLIAMDANSEGFTKGKPFKKIGLKTSDTCELFFEDVKVPKENLIGEEGKGFIYMMKELPRERMVVALQAIGAVRGAMEQTIQYTQERTAFKQPICGFQNTQFKMAEVAMQLEIHTAYVDRCIALLSHEKLTAEMASMAKCASTDMQGKMLDECLQLFGGYGYIWEYPIARFYSDARVSRIYAGTNEIMKVMISRAIFSDYFSALKAKMKKRALLVKG